MSVSNDKIEKYLKLAKKKPQYYAKLGDLYSDDGDFKTATTYYQKAVDNGVLAYTVLGDTWGYRSQYKKAFDAYKKGANKGEAECFARLGFCYETGYVKIDIQKAIECYAKASDLGVAAAARSLGDLYYFNTPIEDSKIENVKNALKYYERAFYLGDIEVAKKIGFIYLNNEEAFNAACLNLKNLLKEKNYTEYKDGFIKKYVRYGVIGLGNMGSGHIANFMKEGNIPFGEVVAIADRKQEKIDRIKNLYPNHTFECYLEGSELIEHGNVEAVIIAVPHYQHPELTILALKKNINVICEKPAGVYTKQVKEMIEVSKNSHALFTMMFNQRTNCVYRKMREIVTGGEIGEVKRVNWIITDWYRSQSYFDSGDWRATWEGEGGGVLFNQSPHQLDLLAWVVGMMPKRLQAFCHFGKWHNIEVEDDVTCYLEYENGATGVFVTSTADAPGTNRFEVLGTGGKIVCENDKLKLYKNEIDERKFNQEYKGGFGSPKFEEIEVETDGENLQHTGICRNFTNAILGIEPLFVDGKEGLKSVELMDAMLMSTWLNKMIELPIDDEKYYELLLKQIKNSKIHKNVEEKILDTKDTYNGSK